MIKSKILLTACLALVVFAVKGQNVEGVMPVDGAGLAGGTANSKGSDLVNVDLFTGIGSVTIPIYNYSLQDLDLGISLSYNAKGIFVDQVASSIGLGWSLNAGGQITRTINALEDEVTLTKNDPSYYDGKAPFYKGAFNTEIGGITKHRDKEYDIFHLGIAGRSVDFIWARYDSNKFFMYPKSELSIRTVRTDFVYEDFYDDFTLQSFLPGMVTTYASGGRRMSFYVIDENGNQFFYHPGDEEYKKYDLEYSDSGSRFVTNKWVLTKVRSSNGNEVKFNYNKRYVEYVSGIQEKRIEHFSVNGSTPPSATSENKEYEWSGYISQLSSIEYPNGVKAIIHWDTSANARCDMNGSFVVDSITIESSYGNNLKNSITYKFNYAYFHTITANTNTEVPHRTPCDDIETSIYDYQSHKYVRLKLKSIDRIGNHVASEKYYTFDYHSTPLPSRYSVKKDYYGFFNNGYTVGGSGVPLHVYNNNFGIIDTIGTDRTPDNTPNLTYIQAGILKKITNGLGGSITIEYQQPVLSNPSCAYGKFQFYPNVHPLVNGGECNTDPELQGKNAPDGLIVKSILFNDGVSDEHSTLTSYDYSGGQRFFQGGYFWLPLEVDQNTYKKIEYSNNMFSSQIDFRGSNHGFSEITVTKENYQTSEQLGKTKYEFSNLMLPDSLNDLFIQDFLDSLTYHLPSIGMLSSKSNLKLHSGAIYHTAYPELFTKSSMGLLKGTTEYNQNDDIISSEIFRYDYNFRELIFKKVRTVSPNQRVFTFTQLDMVNTSGLSRGIVNMPSSRVMPGGEPRLRYKKVIKKSGGRDMITEFNYEYDYADNLKTTSWTDSKGDYYQKETKYAYEYGSYDTFLHTSMQFPIMTRTIKASAATPSVKTVIDHNALGHQLLIQESVFPSTLDTFGAGVWFISSVTNHDSDYLKAFNDRRYLPRLRFTSVYKPTLEIPVALTTATSEENDAMNGATGLTTLVKAKEFTRFDLREDVLEVKLDEQNRYNAYVWDSRFGHKIAEASNARFDEIAYTSFEGLNEEAGCETDYGNWDFNPAAVIHPPSIGGTTPQAVTGEFIYNLNLADITTQLKAYTEYELTFWADIEPKVFINSSRQTLNIKRQGAWSLWSLKFTSGSADVLTIEDNSSLSIVGFIDELRLHPARATMTTYTYEPLFGISSVCDSRNNILYTEYDAQGRPAIVRDINRAIISKTETRNQINNN